MLAPLAVVLLGTAGSLPTAAVAITLAVPPQTFQTKMLSVSPAGVPATKDCFVSSISADGRFVAFSTDADDLVVGDLNGTFDVFVIDRATGVTEIVDVDSNGVQANGFSTGGMLSADGRYVAFESTASNLVANDHNGFSDIFVRDRVDGRTWRLSVDSHGAEGNKPSSANRITPDGRYVAFTSTASNLVPGDTNNVPDEFVHDLWTGTTERVSVNSSGIEGNGASAVAPQISDDGRFVAFSSQATNLGAGFDGNGALDAFVRDRWTGTTVRTSLSVTGGDPNRECFGGITGDGRYAIIGSLASNLVAADTNGCVDFFLRDLARATTFRVTVDSSGAEANGPSNSAKFSADGSVVVFASYASNLVPGDTNGVSDLFKRDLRTGTTTRITHPPIWVAEIAGTTLTPDGSVVVFNGYVAPGPAPLLISGQPFSHHEVFVRGPYLRLSAEPLLVPPAGPVTMAVWDGGAPHGFGIVAAVAVNGVPTFVPFTPVNFDGFGRFHRTLDAPAAFAGNVVTFVGAAFAANGDFDHTNRVTVTFQ